MEHEAAMFYQAPCRHSLFQTLPSYKKKKITPSQSFAANEENNYQTSGGKNDGAHFSNIGYNKIENLASGKAQNSNTEGNGQDEPDPNQQFLWKYSNALGRDE